MLLLISTNNMVRHFEISVKNKFSKSDNYFFDKKKATFDGGFSVEFSIDLLIEAIAIIIFSLYYKYL